MINAILISTESQIAQRGTGRVEMVLNQDILGTIGVDNLNLCKGR